MPFPNHIGKNRYWSKERVTAALAEAIKELRGPLPCYDSDYNHIKEGRLDWPPSRRVLEYYHSMGRAWLAAGANAQRIKLSNVDWAPEEDEFLLDYAGSMTLNDIAQRLRRSYSAVRARLNKTYGIQSRHNQGYMSAAELAREYNCSCHRIRTALREGRIKGRFDRRRNRWEIDLIKILHSPVAQTILNEPKRTHKTCPTDVGDYCRRYGLKRTLLNGKMVYIPVKEPVCV